MLSYQSIIMKDISLYRDHKYHSIELNYSVNIIYKFISIY